MKNKTCCVPFQLELASFVLFHIPWDIQQLTSWDEYSDPVSVAISEMKLVHEDAQLRQQISNVLKKYTHALTVQYNSKYYGKKLHVRTKRVNSPTLNSNKIERKWLNYNGSYCRLLKGQVYQLSGCSTLNRRLHYRRQTGIFYQDGFNCIKFRLTNWLIDWLINSILLRILVQKSLTLSLAFKRLLHHC